MYVLFHALMYSPNAPCNHGRARGKIGKLVPVVVQTKGFSVMSKALYPMRVHGQRNKKIHDWRRRSLPPTSVPDRHDHFVMTQSQHAPEAEEAVRTPTAYTLSSMSRSTNLPFKKVTKEAPLAGHAYRPATRPPCNAVRLTHVDGVLPDRQNSCTSAVSCIACYS
jgi:hypothetical protein